MEGLDKSWYDEVDGERCDFIVSRPFSRTQRMETGAMVRNSIRVTWPLRLMLCTPTPERMQGSERKSCGWWWWWREEADCGRWDLADTEGAADGSSAGTLSAEGERSMEGRPSTAEVLLSKKSG